MYIFYLYSYLYIYFFCICLCITYLCMHTYVFKYTHIFITYIYILYAHYACLIVFFSVSHSILQSLQGHHQPLASNEANEGHDVCAEVVALFSRSTEIFTSEMKYAYEIFASEIFTLPRKRSFW